MSTTASGGMGVQPAKKIELEAVVIRRDGTREDLGTVAVYHRNPLKRAWARIRGVGKVTTRMVNQ